MLYGSQHSTAAYKAMNNEMVLVEKHCFIWDVKNKI